MRDGPRRQRPPHLLLHRRQAVRRGQADRRVHPRRAQRPQRLDPADAAGSRTTAGTCWRSTCRATAGATGAPPASVEEAARLRRSRCSMPPASRKAALVGHSFGSLIALEAAARAPERVTHLALVGTAYPMTVSPALLDGALNDPQRRSTWSTPSRTRCWRRRPRRSAPAPGCYGGSRALMRRVLASNRERQRVPQRLQGLQRLRERRSGDGDGAVPGAVPAGRVPTR